ncbi:MAG: rRNA maturation RNAse YbeY [Caldilineaceae bacterium]
MSFAAREEADAVALTLPPELPMRPRTTWVMFIALPYTRRQAARVRQPVGSRSCVWLAAGTLHLLGFDHATAAEEAAMWGCAGRGAGDLGEQTPPGRAPVDHRAPQPSHHTIMAPYRDKDLSSAAGTASAALNGAAHPAHPGQRGSN